MSLIVESIEKKKAAYEVKINDEIVMIEPELKMKYHLNLGTELDLKTYHELIDENDFAIFYKLCIVKLKKMQTRFELKNLMELKGAKPKIIKQVLAKLESRKYIDDDEYTKIYLQLKSSSKGPRMLEFELRKKGISLEIITKHLSGLDSQEAISHLLKKKLASLKSKSKQQKIQGVKTYLVSKGFDLQSIDHELNQVSFDDDQELINLKRDYEKLLYRFKHLEEYSRNQEIVKRLYQKGYSIDSIKKVMNQTLEL